MFFGKEFFWVDGVEGRGVVGAGWDRNVTSVANPSGPKRSELAPTTN